MNGLTKEGKKESLGKWRKIVNAIKREQTWFWDVPKVLGKINYVERF